MRLESPRDQAMAFIATYDGPDAGVYEKHIVRLAHTWLSILKANYSIQGIVDRILDEFTIPVPDTYGAGWDEFKKQFTAWAYQEEWIKPDKANSDKRKTTRRRKR